MYLNYYQFKSEPFHVTPDPAYLFLAETHKQALGSIIYGIERRKGFIAITGEVGVGKTTILRSYLAQTRNRKRKCIYIFTANITFSGVLKTICNDLGIQIKTDDIYEIMNNIYRALITEYGDGYNVILIIDEAQNVPVETLENLRMLSNLETEKEKLIQILLIGQPELDTLLNLSELRQFKQRIAVYSKIRPLTYNESISYIKHRLGKAQVDKAVTSPFTEASIKSIAKAAKGIPRIINILCDNALITGMGYNKKPVTKGIVNAVIGEYTGKNTRRLLRPWFAYALMAVLTLSLSVAFVHKKTILPYWEKQARLLVSTFDSSTGRQTMRSTGNTTAVPVTAERSTRPEASAETAMPGDGMASKIIDMQYTSGGLQKLEFIDDSENHPQGPPPQPAQESAQESVAAEVSLIVKEMEMSSESAKSTASPLEIPENSMQHDEKNNQSQQMDSNAIIVKKGDHLAKLIYDNYGFVDAQLIKLIKEYNPQIQNINIIMTGDKIVLPKVKDMQARY